MTYFLSSNPKTPKYSTKAIIKEPAQRRGDSRIPFDHANVVRPDRAIKVIKKTRGFLP